MKIVPTIYETTGTRLETYQYTSAHKPFIALSHSGKFLPAVWFKYDLNPITIKYSHRRKPFYSFITTTFAIIGGTFTVAGIIDSIIFTTSNLFKKFELGKLS